MSENLEQVALEVDSQGRVKFECRRVEVLVVVDGCEDGLIVSDVRECEGLVEEVDVEREDEGFGSDDGSGVDPLRTIVAVAVILRSKGGKKQWSARGKERERKQREEGANLNVPFVRSRPVDKGGQRRLWEDRHVALVDPWPAGLICSDEDSIFGEGELRKRDEREEKGKAKGQLELVDWIF